MRLGAYLALGIAAFLYALIVHAPVASLHVWLKSKDAPSTIDAVGLEGSLARGRVSGITSGGRLAVADVAWKLRPLALLLGRLSFHVQGGGEQAQLDGRLTRLPLGGLRLSSFKLGGSLKSVLAAMGQPFVPYDGSANLDIQSLTLEDGIPVDAQGHVEVRGLAWALAREPILFGDFRIEVTTADDAIVAAVSSLAGAVEAAGEARLLDDETRSWSVDLRLKPKPDAPPLVLNQLRSFGPPDSSGFHHLKRQGRMKTAAAAEDDLEPIEDAEDLEAQ